MCNLECEAVLFMSKLQAAEQQEKQRAKRPCNGANNDRRAISSSLIVLSRITSIHFKY